MRRILWMALVALLLCGCTGPVPEETTLPATTAAPTEITEPLGIYLPESELELSTAGAVRAFVPEEDTYAIRVMGNDLLVFSGTERTTLTRFAGERMFAVAQTELRCRVDPADTSFRIGDNGLTYYDANAREVVLLDNDLREIRRVEMSGDMVGKPVVSGDRMRLYYCTAEAIRAYDINTGLDRLLKSIAYAQQSAEDILLNDSVLRCSLVDESGEACTMFVSAETGELYSQMTARVEVSTCGDSYYACTWDGISTLLIFGQDEEAPQVLTPLGGEGTQVWFQTASHGLVAAQITEESTCLDYYELKNGIRSASVVLPGGIYPEFAQVQPDTGNVLVLADDGRNGQSLILSWRKSATAVEDETDYTGPRYTLDAPDVEGLMACAEYADTIGAAHGVQILVGLDAVENQPWDYSLEMEYQVPAIMDQLEKLERLMDQFPEGMFDQNIGTPRICIVRSITGTAVSGSVESAKGIQYWDDIDAYVVLAAGDTLEASFYHEIFHMMETKILSDTRTYYHWDQLNPEGVKYFQDYTTYLGADVSQYLEGENRAFIDAYSMCFPSEDRARIMEYACMPGNEAYFESAIMQEKLETLCIGIRKAFKLTRYTEPLLWEQYLKEPIEL